MSEEIIYYGDTKTSGIKSQAFDVSLMRENNIFLPNALSVSLSDCEMLNTVISWPVVARLSTGDVSHSQKLIYSPVEMKSLLQSELGKSQVSVLLPPVMDREKKYKDQYLYIAKDFTCVHNVSTDQVVMIESSLNSNFLSVAGCKENSVLRLIRGQFGWYFDNLFSSEHPAFDALTHLKVVDIVNHIPLFRDGYIAGYNSNLNMDNYKNNITLTTPVGEPFSFGFQVGACIAHKFRFLADGYYQPVTKNLVLYLKAFGQGSDIINAMVDFHNFILDEIYLPELLTKIKFGESIKNIKDINDLASDISSLISNQQCLVEYFNLPEKFVPVDPDSNVEVKTFWSGTKIQFRVLSEDSSHIRIRFQAKNSNIERIIVHGGLEQVIATCNLNNIETDINISASENPNCFASLVDANNKFLFEESSTYQNSSAKYCSLVYNPDVGFTANGLVILSLPIVNKYLASNHPKFANIPSV